ncbi:hypothetical protein VOLCADRAFT_120721 [Volvox carteri f. nagariensis]|uniref:Uncharacterized protein n=1 Tax=Volvox carteri f. nagariensis TaxID=3068 RepID=D8TS62_VOLCA|nr:uncharacterized protein VOLCADRAFT_120721 [Volvox carteri f. nagariensis]EFJ49770.1 hypothetical protein VOLCADRAFT_120721 [Volvox carteri f. nagariensis]|eukprot:XP_002949277.1 hypothetical protein VOLCADRAFT_120721 [Volvox carteri f. nagariensis]
MEASCSPCEETAMDTGAAPPRAKSKTALNRRPSGYWKVFSNWWRGRYAALKTRPTVNEVIEWYHRNAATSWPAGQVPCLKAVLRQSKGLRPIDGLKEYFREYRKKRKQQATHKDSSDEDDIDELEQEGSVCSEQSSEEDDDDEFENTPPRRQRSTCAARRAAAAIAAEEDATQAAADNGEAACPAGGLGAVQAVFDAWHQVAPGAAAAGLALEDCSAAPALADPVLLPPELACVTDDADGSFLALAHPLATAASSPGDPVHPAVADGMVPIAPSGSPRPPHAPMYGACSPHAPYASYVQAVTVRRRPSLLATTARSRCRTPVGLPPLASARAATAAMPSPDTIKSEAGANKHDSFSSHEDDYARDRCSTGGGMPAPCDARFPRTYTHERVFDGYNYEYGAPYDTPPPYACAPPHPCCYRATPYPVPPYPYRAMPSASYPPPDCSMGGGATSSFSPAAPWPSMPTAKDASGVFPQRQSSVESPAQLDSCYVHPAPHHHLHHHPHPAAWAPWGPADAAASAWQGNPLPPFSHDPAGWGRNNIGRNALPPMMPCNFGRGGAIALACHCGACPESAAFRGAASPCHQHPQGMHPPPPHMCYSFGPRHGMPVYPGRLDMWVAPQPSPRDQVEAPIVEGEACSSSVSEHDGQEHGRLSPCSGTSASQQPGKPSCVSPSAATSGMHWARGCGPMQPFHVVPHGGHHVGPHGCCYPLATPYQYARGLVTAGSVTSMASLAQVPEESPFMAGASNAFDADAVRRGEAPMEAPAAPAETTTACDACDVLPYLADDPAAPDGTPEARGKEVGSPEADAEGSSMQRDEPQGPPLDSAECGLGLGDGFGGVARDTMDQDLAFAFENFVACDTPFDALACH